MEKFYTKYFFQKKITLVGLGGLGRGLEEAKFLAKNGADLIITDLADKKTLKKELKDLEKYKNIKYTLGGHKIEDFQNRDLVLYVNGVPLKNKFIEEAKKKSKITTKSIAFLFYILEKEFGKSVKKIGITGTKGKTTLTEMTIFLVKNFLEEKNKKESTKNNFFISGNFKGFSNLPILEKIKKGDFVIAELDSWLLQGFGDLKISPEISLFANFFADHQDYYHSLKKYFKDKSFIFRFQEKENFFIVGQDLKKDLKKYFDTKKIISKKIFCDFKKNPQWKYKIFGTHNEKNISMILELADVLKISKKITKKTLENFSAKKGNMEFLGEKKNILFFNDNSSTIPESTIANISALRKKFPKKKIYLLAGGGDKIFDAKNFAKKIEKNIFFSFLFEGEGTEKIIKNFSKNFKDFEKTDSSKKAIEKIIQKIKQKKDQKNSIIILSPGCVSFGIFKNKFEREEKFLKEYKNFEKNFEKF